MKQLIKTFSVRVLMLLSLLTLLPSSSDAQIALERDYWVNTTDDYHMSDFYCAERFSYQELHLTFDNGIGIAICYHNAHYWDDSYENSHLGVFIQIIKGRKDENPGTLAEEWYIAPLRKGEWVKEKLIIDRDGTIHYYMDGQDMGSHRFNSLSSLDGIKSLIVESHPYGWWYTHYHYMDNFKLTTPTQVISDDFNDGVLNTGIWQEPVNPDGVREEDGILKQEQLRTDEDFGLRSHPINLTGDATSKEFIYSYEYNGTEYSLYCEKDYSDIRTDYDGTDYYRTALTLDVTNDGTTNTYTIDDGPYLRYVSESQKPCMAINTQTNQMFIFVNSSDGWAYALDGYCYVSSLDNISFEKEVVFTEANWGWWPKFVMSERGKLSVSHFSFAGYFELLSTRNNDGTWTTDFICDIEPDDFKMQSEEKPDVLVFSGNNDGNGIAPVDEGETIDIGTELDKNTNLDGNVVGDVYYCISSGDGSYDQEEGCIVVTKPTDDAAIDGKDIFGEDFKDGYTGLVFMVAPGKGTINVEAETTGNMVLKVKVGDNSPTQMEVDGKTKVSFAYDVSEPTLVYIYGSISAAGAKGMMKAAGTDMLKIYGIEVTSETNGIEAIDNGQLTIDNSPVYNLNGQRVISSPSGRPGGVPTKGIYIQNGKKVLVK